MAEEFDTTADLARLTADVVSAYVGNNRVAADELAKLIGSTYEALRGAGKPAASAEAETPRPDRAAIRKSVHRTI